MARHSPVALAGAALFAAGGAAAVAAAAADPDAARLAAGQDWPPFVLVTGLILVGLAAEEDGVFAAAGTRLARLSQRSVAFFVGAVALVAVVTAPLNLDTTVAFVTPVLVHAARARREDDGPYLYGCLLLANASSLLLPGSNLTNLIVLGRLHLSGSDFASRMAPAWAASLVVTALVVAISERRHLGGRHLDPEPPVRPVVGTGLAAVVAVTVLVLVLSAPALYVLGVGLAATAVRLARQRGGIRPTLEVLGAPVLVGLFGLAVALGALGRAWSGPAVMLSHLDQLATAAVAAGVSVLDNNLPAASLLSARIPPHPFSLLVGLDIGPNLSVTGSLAWVLWLRSARAAGARPSVARASLIGLFAVPLALLAAVGALAA